MDAREELAGLVDPPRRAVGHAVERAAAGTVDARQSEDMEGGAAFARDVAPALFGGEPLQAARLRRQGRSRLVDPGALVIAIHARGGEVAQPACATQQCPAGAQRRIAGGARRHRADDVAGLAEGLGRERRGAIEGVRLDPFRAQPAGFSVGRAGAGRRPALRLGKLGNFKAAVAQTENEKSSCHLVSSRTFNIEDLVTRISLGSRIFRSIVLDNPNPKACDLLHAGMTV